MTLPDLARPVGSTPPIAAGRFRGSALYHSFAHFEARHGPAAAHAVIARLPPAWRALVSPNAKALGILGARLYPYAFVGDAVRAMRDVVHAKDEDAFVRDLTVAGLEALLSTMHRVLLRWLVTPGAFLEHRQEIWNMYHDSGRLNVLSQSESSYAIEDADWPNTDPIVCKVNLEGRRIMLERMGLRRVEAIREKCRAWGHPSCITHFKWS